MKKLGKSILPLIATAMAIAAFVLLIISHNIQQNPFVSITAMLAVAVAAIVAAGADVLATIKTGSHSRITFLLGLVAVVAMGALLGMILYERAYLASALFTWDPFNTNGWTAFYTSVASGALYLLGCGVLIASGFGKEKMPKE